MSTPAKSKIENVETCTDSDLPEAWAEASLADLIVHALGGAWGEECADQRDLVRVNVIRGTEFRNWPRDKGKTAAARCIEPSSLAKRRLIQGDLVVEISGGGPEQPVGRTVVIDQEAIERTTHPLICSNFCRQVRLSTEVDPTFVDAALHFQYALGNFNQFQTETTNLRNLNFLDFITNISIPVPPREEQRRIAARIGAIHSKVAQIRERLNMISLLLKHFRQTVLAAACSGKLTEAWRREHPSTESASTLLKNIRVDLKISEKEEDDISELDLPEIPDSWAWVLTGHIGLIRGGIQKQPKRAPKKNAYPYLRVANVLRDRLDLSEIHKMELFGDELQIHRLERGDLLVVEGNGSLNEIGRSAVWDGQIADCVHQNHIIRVRLCRCVPQYVNAYWNSPVGIDSIAQVAVTTAGLYSLSTKKIGRIPVPLAPLEEQKEIVRRVDAIFKLADAIERRIASATLRAEKVTQATLAKAFRGELVPTEAELARREGRDYETANVLLERIKAERTAAERKQPKRVKKAKAAQ